MAKPSLHTENLRWHPKDWWFYPSNLEDSHNKILDLDKSEKVWFFEETFLLADTSIEVILGISFLIFSNTNI